MIDILESMGEIMDTFKEGAVVDTNDNSCLFSCSMNWKTGLFLLKSMKHGSQLTFILNMSF